MADSKLQVGEGASVSAAAWPRPRRLYREVLRDRPDAAEALEGLGVLVFQQGRAAEAAELFARGVAICPDLGPLPRQPGRSACARPTGSTRPSRIFAGRPSSIPDYRMPGTAWRFSPIPKADLPTPRHRVAEAIRLVATAHGGIHQPGKRTYRLWAGRPRPPRHYGRPRASSPTTPSPS